MFSMPLFMSLLPNEDFKAFDPISTPSFARFSPTPLPACLRFLLLFLKAGAAKFTKICLLSFLGPTFQALVTLMFLGSCFLLILSYLETNDVPFGRFTIFGVGLRLETIFSLILSFDFCDLYPVFFLVLVLLFLLKLELL